MTEEKSSNFTNPDLWIRLIYMLVFGLLSALARLVVAIIAIIQFVVVLFTGSANQNLRDLGQGVAQWTEQAYKFLTFVSELKPYPFHEWPSPPVEPTEVAERNAESVPLDLINSNDEPEEPTKS